MSCEHEKATLAWLYGEGDEAHLTHVGGCTSCQALVEEHEEVLTAVMPVMPSVQRPVTVAPVAANRSMWWVLGALVPLAAAALIFVAVNRTDTATPVPDAPSDPVPVASLDFPDDELDLGLKDLDVELDDLFVDLERL